MRFQIYTKHLPAFALIALLLCSGIFLSSCDEDDEKGSKQTELFSFGPAGVKHGEQIKFIGQNLDQVSSIVLAPGIEITADQFVTRTSDLLEITIPQATEAGKVVLKTASSEIETKTPLSFEVPVVITSITDEARPGANITIQGTFINWIEEVRFSDGIAVTEFVSQSLEELVVTVPMEAQTGFIIFASGGTKPLTFASEAELTVTLPAVTSLSPNAVRHEGTLVITGTDLDLVTAIVFTGDKTVTDFESQTSTEIVVASVPRGVEKGLLTLKQASPVDVVTTQELSIILPIGSSVAPSPAKPGVDDITITGTDLDLIADLTLSGIATPIPSTSFSTHTDTEIVLALPAEAKSGGIKYTTIHEYSGNLGANVIIPAPGPKPLAITLFDDEIFFGGGNWSWGGTAEPASTEQFYSGDISFKHATAGNDGGASVGGMTGVDASGQEVFKFSLFGGPGTDGLQVAAILGSDGADKWDSYNSVTLVEGEWTEYSIPLTSYATVNLANVTRWIFKVEGGTDALIYVDRVGFDPAGPPPLDYYIYDDEMKNGWEKWGGWNTDEQDLANTEEVFQGTKAIKVTFNGQYGALQFHPTTTVFNGYTTFSFRVYAPAAQDFLIQLKADDVEKGDKSISLPQGWSEISFPINTLDGYDGTVINELRFKNNNANVPVTLYFDEIGLKL